MDTEVATAPGVAEGAETSQPEVSRSWKDRFAQLVQEYSEVQDEATMQTLRRFSYIAFPAAIVHFVLAWWFLNFHAPADRPQVQAWADAVGQWQLALASVLTVCFFLMRRHLRTQSEPGWAGVALQWVVSIAYLAFAAAASIWDASIGNGIGTFMIVCQGLAAVSLMRPMAAAALFGMTTAFFWSYLHTQTIDPTLLASMKVQASSMTIIAFTMSVVMWHQNSRTVLLRRQLSRTNEALQTQQRELVTLAERDPLTGLYNRRQFMRLAEMELIRSDRMPRGTSLVMVDLDFFKKVNDEHGHPAGDSVLQQVAGILMNSVRASDLVGRMGGEEFIVLLPQTTPDQAAKVAEKLRVALRAHPLTIEQMELPVTASFGVTGVTEAQKAPLQALYTAADLALYAAKHHGRDRVEVNVPQCTARPTFGHGPTA